MSRKGEGTLLPVYRMPDVVIIGGGVIGLTLALELGQRGHVVQVLDKGQIGREASWAGAGMLPPGQTTGPPDIRQLAKLSASIWPDLSARLHEITGIDNGFRRSGSLNVSLTAEDTLGQAINLWRAESVEVEEISGSELHSRFPVLSPRCQRGFHLPEMSQVRNPRHLKALKQACMNHGVEISEETPAIDFTMGTGRIRTVQTPSGEISAANFVVTAGAWTSKILARSHVEFEVEPIRGQIVLLKSQQPMFSQVIEDGPRYLVPRDDGHILIGSTEEDVGFVKATTISGVAGLLRFAGEVVPELRDVEVVRAWSGLRPKAKRGYPAVGRMDPFSNLFIGAGHFRDGLSQSPATALVLADLIEGKAPCVAIEDLALNGSD